MTMDITTSTSQANTRTFTIRVEMGHSMLVHRHPKGRVHFYQSRSIEIGKSVPEWQTAPPPDWDDVEHRAVCDSRLRVTRTQPCGRLGDKNHPKRLLCKHCARIMPRRGAS